MFKNINNIFSLFLMLTFIGCIYAGIKEICLVQLKTGGFLDDEYNNKDPEVIQGILDTEWNGSIPELYQNQKHMIAFVNHCRSQPRLMYPVEFCTSLSEVGIV
uniref:Uncharacterized protein n=1 Tax=Acyrthosiphon pisum TaxID=7029 RepID=C4WY19_ACYPI|nr:hypothetical protein [Acyrthosiphon pisum]